MSAAVSHELNQPLAAMKTYLAGARLLLRRRRPEEALSAFQRIDDLIDRMGAITRQLKSYARKGGDAFAPLDLRDAVSGALAMMEPQLKRLQSASPAPCRPNRSGSWATGCGWNRSSSTCCATPSTRPATCRTRKSP